MYLGILEADSVKQASMKEKKEEKSTLEERINLLKPGSAVEILSKG